MSTGPTVNIQTAEAAQAEPVHTTAELTMSAESAEGELDYAQEDVSGISSPAQSGFPCTAPPSEQLQQCASVEQVAEKQPVATNLGLNESLSGSSASLESAVTLAAERGNEEVIDEEGEDTGVEGETSMSKHRNDGFRFTVAPAYIRDSEKEEKLTSAEDEHNEEQAVERCLKALEEELADCKDTEERTHTEVDGKRVQFSNKVQYFEEQEFPTEFENGVEEVDEDTGGCLPAEDERPKSFPDILKPLPSEKEKYYCAQMDGSEDETERAEEEETDGKKEEVEEEHSEDELKLKVADNCDDEKSSEVREDFVTSEEVKEEETDRADTLKEEKAKEQDQTSSPHEVTLTEPLIVANPLTCPLPATSQSEVTLRHLRWPQPRPCKLTSTLPSYRHNLPLIIKGKTPPEAWIRV